MADGVQPYTKAVSPHLSTVPPPVMPPLTRQETFGSLRSWWSDSNPNLRVSPTINLHAAAKPLMKLMYERQALEFIRHNSGIALTSMTAKIYGSYLLYVYPSRHQTPRVDLLSRCEYVSVSTKSAILEDFLWRVYRFEALEVHSNMIHDLLQLLKVPVTDIISHNIRRILETLANREASAMATCSSLAAVLM
jgi:hypothetical protein